MARSKQNNKKSQTADPRAYYFSNYASNGVASIAAAHSQGSIRGEEMEISELHINLNRGESYAVIHALSFLPAFSLQARTFSTLVANRAMASGSL